MNLQQVQALKDLYPPLRTRSGLELKTTDVISAIDPKSGDLLVTIKTIFPPSNRRRSNLSVTAGGGTELRIRAVDAEGLADASKFGELVRGRWVAAPNASDPGPLRLSKDNDGNRVFLLGYPPAAPVVIEPETIPDDADEAPTEPAAAALSTPSDADGEEPSTDNGAS